MLLSLGILTHSQRSRCGSQLAWEGQRPLPLTACGSSSELYYRASSECESKVMMLLETCILARLSLAFLHTSGRQAVRKLGGCVCGTLSQLHKVIVSQDYSDGGGDRKLIVFHANGLMMKMLTAV